MTTVRYREEAGGGHQPNERKRNMSNTITVNGVEYVRADAVPGPASEVAIVVVDGRWNFIARVYREDGSAVLTGASVIRYWGTTNGLGELARSGPTSKTQLDPCHGVVRVPEGRVVFTLDTRADLWGL